MMNFIFVLFGDTKLANHGAPNIYKTNKVNTLSFYAELVGYRNSDKNDKRPLTKEGKLLKANRERSGKIQAILNVQKVSWIVFLFPS